MNIQALLDALTSAKNDQDAVPALRTKVAELEAAIESQRMANAKLQEELLNTQVSLESETNRVRSLEVERDDLGFRAGEAEGKLAAILQVARPKATEPEPVSHVEPADHQDMVEAAAPQPVPQQTYHYPSPSPTPFPEAVSAGREVQQTNADQDTTEHSATQGGGSSNREVKAEAAYRYPWESYQ